MRYFPLSNQLRHMALGLAVCTPLLLSLEASAARAFIVPSNTLVYGTNPVINFDAALGETLFNFDGRTLDISSLIIIAADGSSVKPDSITLGKLRNSFELSANQVGTYKVSLVNEMVMANYKDQGVSKRFRGTAAAFAKEVPANAEELQITESYGRIETYATNRNPSKGAFKLTGKGLELDPISHPNDIVDGEPATFRLVLDGKPAAGIAVTLVASGDRYRQQAGEQVFTTDVDGKVKIQWKGPGMYWLEARSKDQNTSIAGAKERRTSYIVSLEVMAQ
jgi:uncharacterized GH25 family protein